ncbi:MAG: xylulose kinase [Streptosporangiaceae bacterium]|jgi:enoyl-CoA hydratase/carnithine racemase|nr:xylulose kinase [Streptosporangiaceae bacterium]
MADIDVDRRDGVVVITLARPARLNAVTPGLLEELNAVLDGLMTDTATRIVVLTGQGRGFCAGMDIRGGEPGSGETPEPDGRMQRIYHGMTRGGEAVARLREIPQPVIAALHGPVVGMGISLALACDFRIADPSTNFVSPFMDLGLSAGDVGLSWLLPRVVGPAKAAEILYRAQTLTAPRAYELGMLTEVVGEHGDVDAALKLAEELLAKSPYGLRHTKELLNLSLGGPALREHLAVENRTQAMAFFTEDFAEGVTATLEKRPPRFRNR